MQKNKLILVESEMKVPKGHFLDNLIETTNAFDKSHKIFWFLNRKFHSEGTYIPRTAKIIKSISTNNFQRKKNKLIYYLEEILFFFINIYNLFFYFFYFILKKNLFNYLKALKSNYFVLPKYFNSFYTEYKKLNLSKKDHILFQTARRKDIALANFIINVDKNHPKFHIRVALEPKKKFKSFFYYLREMDHSLRTKRAFIYLWSDRIYKVLVNESISKKGIYKSNMPWSFYKREYKNKSSNFTIGYVGDARSSRGFQYLPSLIKEIEKKRSFKYLIQYSKITENLLKTKDELIKLSKKNKRIKLIEKYCDYKDFRILLKKIDIMPIIHNASEINNVTSGTLYACITHEIPFVIPHGTKYMKKILKVDAYESAQNLNQYSEKIIRISKKYDKYLKNLKYSSKILEKKLRKDPLKKYIN